MYIFFDRCDLGIDNNNENSYRVVAIFIGDIGRFYYLVKILSILNFSVIFISQINPPFPRSFSFQQQHEIVAVHFRQRDKD